MAKVKKPIKEFWESDKKPGYLVILKTKDSLNGEVKYIKPKPKKKK